MKLGRLCALFVVLAWLLTLAGCVPGNPSETAAATVPDGSSFAVHFIDVGQADAALVLCDGKTMLIDGGNRDDSDLIYAYLKKLSVTHLDCIVATHAHEDHIGGLAGALNFATAETALCPVTKYDSKVFSNFVKYLEEQGKSITVPKPGDTFALGSAQVQVLGPINAAKDTNNTSIVLRIVYGNTSFLFTGDAEREEEQDILNAGYTLKSTVLKVGHHGSDSSTGYPFLREIMPQFGVISVGKGNSYGHPAEETLSRLRDADVTLYRTDLQGTIVCTSDGETVTFATEIHSDADPFDGIGPNSTQPEETEYVLNTGTMKFHLPTCSSVSQIDQSNRRDYTGTREEVIGMGYDPCGRCRP